MEETLRVHYCETHGRTDFTPCCSEAVDIGFVTFVREDVEGQ